MLLRSTVKFIQAIGSWVRVWFLSICCINLNYFSAWSNLASQTISSKTWFQCVIDCNDSVLHPCCRVEVAREILHLLTQNSQKFIIHCIIKCIVSHMADVFISLDTQMEFVQYSRGKHLSQIQNISSKLTCLCNLNLFSLYSPTKKVKHI